MIGQTISHYRILEKLGEGGMGEVYLAEDTRLGRKVALKLLPALYATDAERVRRFEQEAKAASALNHPNILTIYDIGTHQGAPFIVSELLEGETLRERLQAGALPARKTIDYVLQLSRGLAAAHGKGIIHRDLKPENLFITEDARLKILDFGLAKLKPAWGSLRRPAGVEESTETYNQGMDTDPGKVMGTVGYMAPEQVRGQEADYRSDIFAVGVILYEMLSGKRAFARQSAVETMNAILKEEPPDLEEAGGRISPGIARVVNHCLEKNPEQRFQSASDLAFALEALSGTSSGSTMSPESGPPADMRPMKFSILLPEKASLGSFAVSPDGRWLAFTAGTGGQDKLRVRALEVLASQELTGTDGASFPFWSPDSRSIGFFASGKLKKIEVSGGPVQTLCDAGTGLGGTWNRDGVIVFTTLGFGMFRVAAMGGSATLMTPIDRARADYHSPSFLPDGRHFLYYTRSGRKETRGIYLGSLDSAVKQRLLGADSNAVYAPSLSAGRQAGYLLFMREGALLAQPFDTQQLRLTGELLPVAERVGRDPNVNRGNFSVSHNGVLVYDPSVNRQSKQLIWVDRQGKLIGSLGMGCFTGLRLSPDQKRVVIDRFDNQTDTTDLWLYDVAGGGASRFTFDAAYDIQPLWSPDGSRIVWASIREGSYDLYQKAASGAGQDQPLLKSGNWKIPTDWSRDGRLLIYYEIDPKTKRDIWVLPLTGDRKPFPYLQTESSEAAGQLSPDGRFIAYASDESGGYEVYVQSFPSAGGQRQVSIKGGAGPYWRRDGKELFYYAPDGKLMAVDVKIGAAFETGVPHALFEFRSGNAVPTTAPYTVTADGKRFLVNTIVDESGGAPLTVVVNWQAELKW